MGLSPPPTQGDKPVSNPPFTTTGPGGVGVGVGVGVGEGVGEGLGEGEGDGDGDGVGDGEGNGLGVGEAAAVGVTVGVIVGEAVGVTEGIIDGVGAGVPDVTVMLPICATAIYFPSLYPDNEREIVPAPSTPPEITLKKVLLGLEAPKFIPLGSFLLSIAGETIPSSQTAYKA